jgi:predicted SAM-dependent methyltransferase
MEPEGIRLHLGCGATALAGWENADRELHSAHVDAAFDVEHPWPYLDDSASAVYASHLLEHLHDPWAFFAELWRVMRPGAHCLLRLPYGGHRSAWADITHVRRWYPESFAFLQPGYAAENGNPQHQAMKTPFGISAIDVRMDEKVLPYLRWRLVRRRLQRLVELVPPLAEEMFVDIVPLKTAEVQAGYRVACSPTIVPLNFFVYTHVWQCRPLRDKESATMHYLLPPPVAH